MKKTIFCLLFLLHVGVIIAQYDVSWSLIPNSSPPKYTCTIVPNPSTTTTDFVKQDLITWIFPDGQFLQQEIQPDLNGQIPKSNTVVWQPYVNAPSGPDKVIAYVAKKGQPGNPPKREAPTPITGIFSGNPAPFSMTATEKWQINRSWEFSPDNETFLIVSYRIEATCDIQFPNSNIQLTYDPKEMNLVTTNNENLSYQNESIIGPTLLSPTQNMVEISDLKYNGKINHVYLKFKVDKAVRKEQRLGMSVSGNICGDVIASGVSIITKGTPHDPNQKIVNDSSICSDQPDSTNLFYNIRFHNDGDAIVDHVDVEDNLPIQLDPNTFKLVYVPDFQKVKNSGITGSQFFVKFKDLGLPGLNQTVPQHYAYDQSFYDFTFKVLTKPKLTTGSFSNKADVFFYKGTQRLPVVSTNNCIVTVDSCTTPSKEQTTLVNNVKIAPNPSSDAFAIFIELSEKAHLVGVIRGLDGRIIETLTNKEYLAGAHQLYWSNAKAPAGIYLLDINIERGRVTRKIIKL